MVYKSAKQEYVKLLINIRDYFKDSKNSIHKARNEIKILDYENQKLVVNLGAGAAVEKDKDSAINYLESRIKEMEVALNETNAKKQEAIANLEQGKHEMNRLVQEGRSKKQ